MTETDKLKIKQLLETHNKANFALAQSLCEHTLGVSKRDFLYFYLQVTLDTSLKLCHYYEESPLFFSPISTTCINLGENVIVYSKKHKNSLFSKYLLSEKECNEYKKFFEVYTNKGFDLWILTFRTLTKKDTTVFKDLILETYSRFIKEIDIDVVENILNTIKNEFK